MQDRLHPGVGYGKKVQEHLQKIDHLVVLMLENRSFDHMLGYLTLEEGRKDVEGLTNKMFNEYNKVKYKVRLLDTTRLEEDPGHESADVVEQLGNGNGGFVSNFARHYPESDDLGDLLVLPRPRPISTRLVPARLLNYVARWQARAWKSKILTQMKESRRQKKLSDFQQGLVAARGQFGARR